jgi:hypothetical protein
MDTNNTEWREKGVLLISKLLNKNNLTVSKLLGDKDTLKIHFDNLCTDIQNKIHPALYIPSQKCHKLANKADLERLIIIMEKMFEEKTISLKDVCNHYLCVEKHFALLAQAISEKKKEKKPLVTP